MAITRTLDDQKFVPQKPVSTVVDAEETAGTPWGRRTATGDGRRRRKREVAQWRWATERAAAPRCGGGGVCWGDLRAAWTRNPLELCVGGGEELNCGRERARGLHLIRTQPARGALHRGHRVPSDLFCAVQIQVGGACVGRFCYNTLHTIDFLRNKPAILSILIPQSWTLHPCKSTACSLFSRSTSTVKVYCWMGRCWVNECLYAVRHWKENETRCIMPSNQPIA
jgi:hypothetical protein